MNNIYSAGCKEYLDTSSQDAPTDSLYLECVVLSRASCLSGLVISCLLILCAFLYRYILTPSFFKKYYGGIYSDLQPRQRKNFHLRHIDCFLKIISLICILRPVYLVLMQGRHWFDPYYDGSNFALGDSAFLATETLAALFIFQLLCEEETKPVDAVHHVGGLLIILGYPAWTVSLPVGSSFTFVEAKAMAEICLLWVLFSDAYGAAKNTSHILRRCLQPASAALGWLYFFGFYSILLSTALEAISVLYATSVSWDKLSTFYKLVIFVLQGLFTLAKSRSIQPFYTMYRKQKAKHLGGATTGMSNPISLLP